MAMQHCLPSKSSRVTLSWTTLPKYVCSYVVATARAPSGWEVSANIQACTAPSSRTSPLRTLSATRGQYDIIISVPPLSSWLLGTLCCRSTSFHCHLFYHRIYCLLRVLRVNHVRTFSRNFSLHMREVSSHDKGELYSDSWRKPCSRCFKTFTGRRSWTSSPNGGGGGLGCKSRQD